MPTIPAPTDADLGAHHCLEGVDRVPGDPEMTAFRRAARLHQARWREKKCLPIGSQPMDPNPGKRHRPLGSRIDLAAAKNLSNFLGQPVREAVGHRIANRERHQTLNVDRLHCDLLSSMPMCFNLFGWFHGNPKGLARAARALWPDAPGRAKALRFEWSPGRLDPAYLGNRSAFDAAFELELPGGGLGVIGVETKYHEHCKAEKRPSGERLARYRAVARESEAFKPGALDAILGKDLQQVWLDHLLALSIFQHKSGEWKWAKFVLVHPAKNTSFGTAAQRYRVLLRDAETFEAMTVESILNARALPKKATEVFRERYLW